MKLDKLFKKVFKNFGNNFQSNSIGSICSSGSITQINSSFNSTSTINGKTYKGNNIQVNGNKVIIDGVEQTQEDDVLVGPITIIVNGDCDSVQSDNGDVTVNGNTNIISGSNGDVTVDGNVEGNISTSNGDVDVKGKVAGNISTSNGDIISRK